MVIHRILGSFAAVTFVIAHPAAAATVFTATLAGANEVPGINTPATGFAKVRVNGTSLVVSSTFSGLSSGLRDGHIHCCVGSAGNAGVAIGFTALPLGQTSGTIANTYDLTLASTFRAAFIGNGTVDAARERFLLNLNNGQTYFNVHSINVPSGEIRGQLLAVVPEPSTWAMMIAGFGVTGAMLRRRRPARKAITPT